MKFEDVLINEVNLEGFQIIRSQYFKRSTTQPIITLWSDQIAFSASVYDALSNCECIRIYVNEEKRCILLQPTTSSDPEAIKWTKKGKPVYYSRLSCATFSKYIFSAWRLDEKYRYRSTGRLVKSDSKIMLLFDFSNPQVWNGKKLISGAKY